MSQALPSLDEYQTKFLTVGGCRLVADVRDGDGTTCVYLHGALMSRVEARRLFGGPDFRGPVILPDSRGHGDSVSGDYSDQSWQRLIDDVVAWLDHFDAHDVFLAGTSMGAVVAPAVAMARPKRVSSLGLVLPVLLGRDNRPSVEHQKALDALSASFEVPALDHIVSRYAETPGVAEWIRGLPRTHKDLAGVSAYFQQDRSGAGLPYTTDDLRQLHIPATVVAGSDAVHPAEVGRRLAEILPDAQLVELTGIPLSQHEAHISAAFRDHLDRVVQDGEPMRAQRP